MEFLQNPRGAPWSLGPWSPVAEECGKIMSNPNLSTEVALDRLREVIDPDLKRDIVSLSMVHDLALHDGAVYLTLRLTTPACPLKGHFEKEIQSRLLSLPGVEKVELKFDAQVPQSRLGANGKSGLPGVKNIVAVGSGKGGVGKTTVAVNLAVALAELGSTVGLLDADVYGPNVPRMMGIQGMPRILGENRIEPLKSYGVRLMSMGFVNPGDKPVIWRGPMLHSAMQQFLRQVEWGELDYLIIDMPPGTGDIALSLAQNVPLTGAIVVTTPSDVSLEDGRKALNMFQQLQIDVLGVVENMSYFTCPHCNEPVDIFSHGGGEATAEKFGVPFLGALPLLPAVRVGGDQGKPVAIEGGEAAQAKPFYELARRVAAQVSIRALAGDPGEKIHVRA